MTIVIQHKTLSKFKHKYSGIFHSMRRFNFYTFMGTFLLFERLILAYEMLYLTHSERDRPVYLANSNPNQRMYITFDKNQAMEIYITVPDEKHIELHFGPINLMAYDSTLQYATSQPATTEKNHAFVPIKVSHKNGRDTYIIKYKGLCLADLKDGSGVVDFMNCDDEYAPGVSLKIPSMKANKEWYFINNTHENVEPLVIHDMKPINDMKGDHKYFKLTLEVEDSDENISSEVNENEDAKKRPIERLKDRIRNRGGDSDSDSDDDSTSNFPESIKTKPEHMNQAEGLNTGPELIRDKDLSAGTNSGAQNIAQPGHMLDFNDGTNSKNSSPIQKDISSDEEVNCPLGHAHLISAKNFHDQ